MNADNPKIWYISLGMLSHFGNTANNKVLPFTASSSSCAWEHLSQRLSDTPPKHRTAHTSGNPQLASCCAVSHSTFSKPVPPFNGAHPNGSLWHNLHEQPCWGCKLPCEQVCVAQRERRPPAPQICPNLSCAVAQAWRPAVPAWNWNILHVQLANIRRKGNPEKVGLRCKWWDFFFLRDNLTSTLLGRKTGGDKSASRLNESVMQRKNKVQNWTGIPYSNYICRCFI